MAELTVDQTLLRRVTEALVFAADEPVTAATIADVFAEVTGDQQVDTTDVERAVADLNSEYESGGRTLRIEEWAGGYRMATVPEVAPFVKALLEAEEERRLSRSLMETLAVVAFQQPVTKPEIDFVRGVNADYALRKLLELRLIAVAGRSEGVGRPLLYGTTPHFLEQFGLPNLEALPRPREIEELLEDPAFSRERAELLSSLDSADRPSVVVDLSDDAEA
jgi:segregation and condensation protein B